MFDAAVLRVSDATWTRNRVFGCNFEIIGGAFVAFQVERPSFTRSARQAGTAASARTRAHTRRCPRRCKFDDNEIRPNITNPFNGLAYGGALAVGVTNVQYTTSSTATVLEDVCGLPHFTKANGDDFA